MSANINPKSFEVFHDFKNHKVYEKYILPFVNGLLSILLLGQALCKVLNEQWLRNRYATKTFENKKDENTWLRREFYRKWVQLCSNATKLFFKNYLIALYP